MKNMKMEFKNGSTIITPVEVDAGTRGTRSKFNYFLDQEWLVDPKVADEFAQKAYEQCGVVSEPTFSDIEICATSKNYRPYASGYMDGRKDILNRLSNRLHELSVADVSKMSDIQYRVHEAIVKEYKDFLGFMSHECDKETTTKPSFQHEYEAFWEDK